MEIKSHNYYWINESSFKIKNGRLGKNSSVIKCLPSKHEYLSLISRAHIIKSKRWYVFPIPTFRRQKQADPRGVSGQPTLDYLVSIRPMKPLFLRLDIRGCFLVSIHMYTYTITYTDI